MPVSALRDAPDHLDPTTQEAPHALGDLASLEKRGSLRIVEDVCIVAQVVVEDEPRGHT
jgi:hypothetical protein